MRIRNVTIRCALFTLALLAAHGTAAAREADLKAPDAKRFGEPKQLTISSDASLTFQRRTQNGADGAVTTLTLFPAADYFVLRDFSLGGFVGVEYTKAGDSRATRFSFGPRIGYNVWLSEKWSIWPKLGFSYAYTRLSGDVHQNALALNVFAPFTFHPVPHFFAGLGPFVDTDLNGDHRATIWGAKLTVGGWL